MMSHLRVVTGAVYINMKSTALSAVSFFIALRIILLPLSFPDVVNRHHNHIIGL